MTKWKALRRRIETLERQVPPAPEEEPTDDEVVALSLLHHVVRTGMPPTGIPITDVEWAELQRLLEEREAGAPHPAEDTADAPEAP